MSYQGPKVFLKAVSELAKLPGVGEKTAQRLVFHMVHGDDDLIPSLTAALTTLKNSLRLCSRCCGLTDVDPCPVCTDESRDAALLCVVEDPSDLFAIERSGQFKGMYHVLHGSLAPLDGVGPEQLKVRELMVRVENNVIREVILATNPNVEGEATALYLAKLLAEKGVSTSRIAMGIPMGGHLEYADQMTVGRAILERRNFTSR